MENTANQNQESWIQLEIPGLFEQPEKSSDSNSEDEIKAISTQLHRIRGYTNEVRLCGLKTNQKF